MPIAGLISGLTVVAGGIAGIVLGTQANEREAGSGNTAFAAGITAIIAGVATATGGIIAIYRKITEVMDRDEGALSSNELARVRAVLEDVRVQAEADRERLNAFV
jgi:hypothetical protein